IVPGVRGAYLTAHPRLALRHDGKAETCDKDALGQQHVTHAYGRGRLSYDYRHNWRLARERLEPGFLDRRAEVAGVIPKLLHSVRMTGKEVHRGERTGCHCGW